MPLIQNKLELLSIHIPKTGGTSFRKSLQRAYGADAYLRLDFKVRQSEGRTRMEATNRTEQSLLDRLQGEGELPSNIRAVHGHFHYEDFARFFDVNDDTKVVTWLREPVRRTVSNYYYLISKFESEISHTALSRELFERLCKSVTEFAANSRDGRLYADHLRGRELEAFDFIGITEEYESELERFAALMGFQEMPTFRLNRAKQAAPELNALAAKCIADLNSQNLEIYSKALAMRGY